MKILANIGISLAALLAIVYICVEGLMLAVFSGNREFWYASHGLSAAILMLALGVLFRFRVRKALMIGASLFFSLCAVVILAFHLGEPSGYYARMDIAIPMWHSTTFTYAVMGFGVIPLLLLIKKWPNKRPGGVAGTG